MALLLVIVNHTCQACHPGFQEPLINALAKIAQWKGEDRELYKYLNKSLE
jgi:hypothetical protein